MKSKMACVLALLLGCWSIQSVAGGIVLERTRVIYDASKKEAALSVANHSEQMPYLLQSWVDTPQETSRGPFIITPPLFRLEAGDSSSLRIIKTDGQLPTDKESLFYVNVRAIPAQKKTEIDKDNVLTLVFKTRIKLFYRPTGLKGKSYDAYKSLEYKRSNNKLDIYNPSAYYVVFAGLALGKTELTDKIDYIAPGQHLQLVVPAAAENTVKWAAINDYGGQSQTEMRTLP
ncbi:fimbrial biogenesis chaperone [Escherichia whittamii]|uniref:fimbrial biogenesis chaperone n=1 Tax=Escherichia whittamii TaxID=2762229 RepID=UPI002DB9194E|nr:molecular chaperone [Escherichia whittamii]EEZ4380871.1 molecular chaperone [Escherichia coli]MEB7938115.1 molecular chaperone [Escherichia whittamii]